MYYLVSPITDRMRSEVLLDGRQIALLHAKPASEAVGGGVDGLRDVEKNLPTRLVLVRAGLVMYVGRETSDPLLHH